MSIRHMLLIPPLLTACATDTLDEASHPINGPGAQLASQWQRDRAVWLVNCTATRISARWAVTAAHCQPQPEADVFFYAGGPGVAWTEYAEIAEVVMPPGVSGSACAATSAGCWDTSGTFADIALIRLKSHDDSLDENDLDGAQATLAWSYPGDGEQGTKVGAGNHGGGQNPAGVLMQHTDPTSSIDDNNGLFFAWTDHTDDGDSGGPFYYQDRILGVLRGSAGGENYYTSVPEHLPWILDTIEYRWRGQPPQATTKYTGTELAAFYGTEAECQYVCEHRSSCEAYNHTSFLTLDGTSNCRLYTNVSGVATASHWSGALKHGARQTAPGRVVGYARADGVDAVVHLGFDNHIHELALDAGIWKAYDLQGSAPAPAPFGQLSAYRRSDDRNAIVYRTTAGHIIELALLSTGWKANDLTNLAVAETAVGSPVAYVKADGVNAVVYRGTSGHLIELRLGSRGWVARDLMNAAGSTASASSDPAAFVRSDGVSSIVFRSGEAIFEAAQAVGGAWEINAPSLVAGGAAAVGRPFGFTTRDGTNAIAYRTAAGQLVRLTLGAGGWTASQIATGTAGDVTAYTRTDLVDAVVFRSTANKIIELASGTAWDLTQKTSSPVAVTNPAVYHRNDGYNIVVYEAAANHVRELSWKRGASAWGGADLTAEAGEIP